MSNKPERILAPTEATHTAAEIAEWHRCQAILAADPRTAGSANRPKALVDRVLADAAKAGGK